MHRASGDSGGPAVRLLARFALLVGMSLLGGCASSVGPVDVKARTGGAVSLTLPAGEFRLQAFERPATGEHAYVFIEGDGRPWRAGGRVVATDPTPLNTPLLDWMLQTSGPALYLARPCYFKPEDAGPCSPMLWTYSRYSETVLASMHAALNVWLERHPDIDRLTLVGHSGGGVLAILLGERLPQVHRVIALAAPLDIDIWADLHGYGRLFDSINPAREGLWREDVERDLLFGQKDAQVPPEHFLPVARNIPGARVRVVDGAGHACCEAFARYLGQPARK